MWRFETKEDLASHLANLNQGNPVDLEPSITFCSLLLLFGDTENKARSSVVVGQTLLQLQLLDPLSQCQGIRRAKWLSQMALPPAANSTTEEHSCA